MTLVEHLLAKAPELTEQWHPSRNADLTGDDAPNGKSRVWWRCENGHEWQATIDSRVYLGRGCPYCAGQSVADGENDLLSVAPAKAALWHPTRNAPLQPTDVTTGSHKRIWWQCEHGHEWQAAVYAVVKDDTGCPYCTGKRPIPGETDLATTHPDAAALWHSRNKHTPREVSGGSHKKVWWQCARGHEWEAMVVSVAIDGSGCPYCAGRRAIPGETDLQTACPDVAAQWDEEKNGVLQPSELLPSAHDKVWWRCELGHSWQAAVFSRTRKKAGGCPYCMGRKVLAGFNDLATVKPRLAEEWYQPLNGELTPMDVTTGSNKRVWWQCGEGHVWQAVVYSRTRRKGSGCPICAGVVKKKGAALYEEEKAYTKKRRPGTPNPGNYINVSV